MRTRDKYNMNKYVLLILVKLYTKSSPNYKIQREDSSKKLQKEKLSLGRLAAQLLLLTRGNRRDVPLNTMFLHTATVAKEVHFVYLLLVVRFKFLPFRSKLSLELFFLH